MILLQTGYRLFGGGGTTPQSIVISFFGVLVGVAVLILIAAIINRRTRPRSAAEIQTYSAGVFRRTAKSIGLPPAHVEMLENLVRACKVRQPMLVFTSAGLLDDTLKKGLYSLEAARELSEEERERRRTLIFQIKQIVERNARRGTALSSTSLLKPGQILTITPDGGSPFSSRLVSNMKDFLTVSAPAGAAGADTRWMRGTGLLVYLWRENDAGYSFHSKVLGYDTVKGVSSVLIQHSRTMRREQRRRTRRREIMRACFFYPIRITETAGGRTTERKASVDRGARSFGRVIDLSAGGCAIRTDSPFPKGKLIMLEFDIDKKAPVRAFGKVMHVRRQVGNRGVSMHIMFTSVTRQHLNRISEFVYDFTRPTTMGEIRQQIDRSIPGRAQPKPISR
ncbi:MAG TPA: PilZ domain-containing protein [Spirochaetia bacterium]|nr:PilZ domain-containing protein [Spirochaetia bacterium]